MAESINEITANWIAKAENDLKVVVHELNNQDPVTDCICFHSQQCAEKYLKAFLVHQNIEPEKTHKIERLIEACMQIDKEFETIKDAVLLTEYAVSTRYPDDFYQPSFEEAKDAYDLALKAKSFVLNRIK